MYKIFIFIMIVLALISTASPPECNNLPIDTTYVQCVTPLDGGYEYIFNGIASFCYDCNTSGVDDSVLIYFENEQQDSLNKLFEHINYDHDKMNVWLQCVMEQVIEEVICMGCDLAAVINVLCDY